MEFREQILDAFKEFNGFEDIQQPLPEVVTDSLDLVEFSMYVEHKTGYNMGTKIEDLNLDDYATCKDLAIATEKILLEMESENK